MVPYKYIAPSVIWSTEAEERLLSVHNSTSKPPRLDRDLHVRCAIIPTGHLSLVVFFYKNLVSKIDPRGKFYLKTLLQESVGTMIFPITGFPWFSMPADELKVVKIER